MPTVHLAGNEVRIGTRVIQRCLVCGYKLVDTDLSRVAVISAGDGSRDNVVSVWGVGHLIEVCEGNPTRLVDIGTTDEPVFPAAHWPDSCLDLVE